LIFFCGEALEKCSDLINNTDGEAIPIRCNDVHPLDPSLELYPEEGWNLSTPFGPLFTPCFIPPDARFIEVSTCPSETTDIPCCVFPFEKDEKNGECQIRCPWGTTLRLQKLGMQAVLGGFIASVIFIVPALIRYLDPEKRKWPSIIPFWILLGGFLLVSSSWWAWGFGVDGYEEWLCESNTLPTNEHGFPEEEVMGRDACIYSQSILLRYLLIGKKYNPHPTSPKYLPLLYYII